jgi:hypothetical protein
MRYLCFVQMKLLRKHLSGILFLIVAEAWGVLVWGLLFFTE